jgi:hypothetical protein
MRVVHLLCFINVAHILTAFEFASTIGRVTVTVTVTVVHFHVVTYASLALEFLATLWTFVCLPHTLNLQVRAVCFLILVSAFMSLFQG